MAFLLGFRFCRGTIQHYIWWPRKQWKHQCSFRFKFFSFTTDFGSIGGSASIGYYTYTDNINNVTYGTQTFGKKDGGTVDLGAFVEGQHIGFYLERNNGQKVTDFFFKEQNGILTLTFNKNGGHGGDETIALAGITAITDSAPSGQPLPGVLAALLIGGATFGVLRLRRKYSKA